MIDALLHYGINSARLCMIELPNKYCLLFVSYPAYETNRKQPRCAGVHAVRYVTEICKVHRPVTVTILILRAKHPCHNYELQRLSVNKIIVLSSWCMSYLVSNVAMSILPPVAKEYTRIYINYSTKHTQHSLSLTLTLFPST